METPSLLTEIISTHGDVVFNGDGYSDKWQIEAAARGLPQHARDPLLPAMAAVRSAADLLEGIVADDLWPLPTYQEMLFIR